MGNCVSSQSTIIPAPVSFVHPVLPPSPLLPPSTSLYTADSPNIRLLQMQQQAQLLSVSQRREWESTLTSLRLGSSESPSLPYSTWLSSLLGHHNHTTQHPVDPHSEAERLLFLRSPHASMFVFHHVQQEPMVLDLHVSLLVLSFTHSGIGAASLTEMCYAGGRRLFMDCSELLTTVDRLPPIASLQRHTTVEQLRDHLDLIDLRLRPLLAWLLVTSPLPLRHLSPSECIPLSTTTSYRTRQFAVRPLSSVSPSSSLSPSLLSLFPPRPLAFHGTTVSNLHSILRRSLRCSGAVGVGRSGPAIWSADELQTSVRFMREPRVVNWKGSQLEEVKEGERRDGVMGCVLLEMTGQAREAGSGYATWTEFDEAAVRVVGLILISGVKERQQLTVRARDHRDRVEGWASGQQSSGGIINGGH